LLPCSKVPCPIACKECTLQWGSLRLFLLTLCHLTPGTTDGIAPFVPQAPNASLEAPRTARQRCTRSPSKTLLGIEEQQRYKYCQYCTRDSYFMMYTFRSFFESIYVCINFEIFYHSVCNDVDEVF
jgi:hypothetical protein